MTWACLHSELFHIFSPISCMTANNMNVPFKNCNPKYHKFLLNSIDFSHISVVLQSITLVKRYLLQSHCLMARYSHIVQFWLPVDSEWMSKLLSNSLSKWRLSKWIMKNQDFNIFFYFQSLPCQVHSLFYFWRDYGLLSQRYCQPLSTWYV